MDQRKALYQTQPILRKALDEIPQIKINVGYCPDGLFMETNEKRDIEIIIIPNPSRGTDPNATPHSIWLILLQLAYRNPELTIIKKEDSRFTLAKPTEYIGGIDPAMPNAQAILYKIIAGQIQDEISGKLNGQISFFDLFLICKRNLEKNGST